MYVVLDTCVLLRALGDAGIYRKVREHILEVCDVIASSKEILKECRAKASTQGMPPTILEIRLQEIKDCTKLKVIPKSKLQLQRIRKKPGDSYDEKFLVAAVAVRAGCIITTDHGLLKLDPYGLDRTSIRVLRPEDYPCQYDRA